MLGLQRPIESSWPCTCNHDLRTTRSGPQNARPRLNFDFTGTMASTEDVEFKTVDGLMLRGRLYHSGALGPGVVMCPGVSFVELQSYRVIC